MAKWSKIVPAAAALYTPGFFFSTADDSRSSSTALTVPFYGRPSGSAELSLSLSLSFARSFPPFSGKKKFAWELKIKKELNNSFVSFSFLFVFVWFLSCESVFARPSNGDRIDPPLISREDVVQDE